MTNVPITEELGFSIEGALQGIAQIDDALQQVVSTFQVGLADAMSVLTAAGADVTPLTESLDVAGLGPAIDSALEEAAQGATVPVDADTAEAQDAIAGLGSEQVDVPVDADTSEAEAAIGGLDDESVQVPIDADTSAAQDAIDALESDGVVVPVDADTAGLDDALSGASSGAQAAGTSLGGLTSQTAAFSAAAAIGRGEAGGLTEGMGALGGGAAAIGAGFAAGAASIGFFFNEALQAQAATQRFNQTFGDLADSVNRIDVGNLDDDLSDLALSLGADDDQLRNVASSLFLFQTGAGTSNAVAAEFSETVLALSARASALNPALGTADQIAGRLSNTLGRGGRFLSQYQIDLSSTEIKARAAQNAEEGLGDGVSFASLQLAGGQLALEKYGGHLEEDIAKGTANPIIQLRALGQAFKEAAEEIGAPLVAPIFELLQQLEPLAVSVARAIGALGQVAIPVLQAVVTLLGPLGPLLNATADGLSFFADAIDAVPAPARAAAVAVTAIGLAAAGAADGMIAAGIAFAVANPEIVAVAAALAIVGTALKSVFDEQGDVVADTSVIAGVFTEAGSGADSYSDALGKLSGAIDEYLRKQLAIEQHGTTGLKTLTGLGFGYREATAAIAGTSAAYATFSDALLSGQGPLDGAGDAANDLSNEIGDARIATIDGAKATLENAKASGLLTEEQIRAAEANHVNSQAVEDSTLEHIDQIAVLRELTPTIDANTRATNDSALVNAQASGSFSQLVSAIASGQASVPVVTGQLEAFGFTTQAAADGATALTDAVTQAVANIVSGLPTAADAAQQWQKDTSAAFEQLQQDSENASGDVQADLKALADSQDPARFVENLQKQAASIVEFQGNLQSLISQGFAGLAGFIAQQPIEIGAPLAAQLASHPNVAAMAAVGLQYGGAVTAAFQTFINQHAGELGLAVGTDLGNGFIVGATPIIGAAMEQVGAETSRRFHVDFTAQTTEAARAAALALAQDRTISQAAGEKGLEALRAYVAQNGPVSWQQAQQIAIGGAKKAIDADATLKAGAQQKGADVTDAYGKKVDLKGKTESALDAAAGPLGPLSRQVGTLTVSAGDVGFDVGVGFDQGLAAGILNENPGLSDIRTAGATAGAAAGEGARGKKGTDEGSPSKVAIAIGRNFVAGLAAGLTDAEIVEAAGVTLARSLTATTSAGFATFGATLGGVARDAAGQFRPDLTTPTVEALGAVSDAVSSDPSLAQATALQGIAAADALRAGFTSDTAADAATTALAEIANALAADPRVPTAARAKAVEASAAFVAGLDLSGTADAIPVAARALTTPTALADALREAGRTTGAAFGDGTATGIRSGGDTIGQAASDTAERAVVASRDGLTPASGLGARFAEAVAAGISEGAPAAGRAAAEVGEVAVGGLGIDQIRQRLVAALREIGADAAGTFVPDLTSPVVTALTDAAAAVAASPGLAPQARQKGTEAADAFGDGFTPETAERAVSAAMLAVAQVIARDPSLPAATRAKSTETVAAFQAALDFTEPTATAVGDAATALATTTAPTATAASEAGVTVGAAFTAGAIQGLGTNRAQIEQAAALLAQGAVAGASGPNGFDSQSPSRKGIRLGREFTSGVAIGIEDAAPTATEAAIQLGQDTIERLERELQRGLARAAAKANAEQLVAQLVSAATAALPAVSSEISTFTSDLANAASAQRTAIDSLHEAYRVYGDDQDKVERLTRRTGIAYGVLATAAEKLARDTAAHAPKATIEVDKAAFDAAKQAFDDLDSQLKSARGQIDSDREAISSAAKGLKDAGKTLAEASDPQTFVHNLRSQTQASRSFLADIAKLSKEGFTDLARALAAQGPEAAGKLADSLASSKSKARAAEAAIDQAAAFAKTYDSRITAILGGGTAAAAGQSAGTSAASAFSDAFEKQLRQNGPDLKKILAATPIGIPLLPAVPNLAPQVIATPFTPPPPQLVAVPAAAGPQSLELDLTIVLDDGRVVQANANVPLPPRTSTLAQRVKAEVHAN